MIWSTAARADLADIHSYIAESNDDGADEFIRALDAKARSFANLGLSGISREQFGHGIRSFEYRQRIVYFTLTDDILFALRVIHGRKDVSSDDFNESGT